MILMIEPRACPRPRVTRRGTVYYPKTYQDWVKECSKLLAQITLPDGPLHITVIFVFKRVKRLPRRGGRVIHDRRPDLDNCVKSLLDALPIKDDKIISSLSAQKYYASSDETPHIELKIKPHNPQ